MILLKLKIIQSFEVDCVVAHETVTYLNKF